jgi:hypothetical protein
MLKNIYPVGQYYKNIFDVIYNFWEGLDLFSATIVLGQIVNYTQKSFVLPVAGFTKKNCVKLSRILRHLAQDLKTFTTFKTI